MCVCVLVCVCAIESCLIPMHDDDDWCTSKRTRFFCCCCSARRRTELDQIRRDVQSRLWCTYRKGFAPIGQAGYTSDRGWGCMLRCGQMMLAQALIALHLGRDWFWTPECRYANGWRRLETTSDNHTFTFT